MCVPHHHASHRPLRTDVVVGWIYTANSSMFMDIKLKQGLLYPEAEVFHYWRDSEGGEHYTGLPLFTFCSLKSKEKGWPPRGRVHSRAGNSCVALKFHILLPQLQRPRQEKQQEDLFDIYSQDFFFLISSEMNMNTPWSLHSAGANPHWKLGAPRAFSRMQSVDIGVPAGSPEGPAVHAVALSLEPCYI